MSDLKKMRQHLEEQLELLENRLRNIEKNRSRKKNALEQDWEEQATVRQNDEVLDGLEHEGTIQIEAIRTALSRIDEGTYGTCDGCEKPIAPARLKALPHATLCIACAEAKEKEAGR